MAVHAPLPLARGSAAEADAARSEGGAVLDPEEEVAEEAALDAVVPVLRVGGESLAPRTGRTCPAMRELAGPPSAGTRGGEPWRGSPSECASRG